MQDGIPFVEGRGILGIALRPPRKPLDAAVEGYALAGGFDIVLACDLVVCARDAFFGIPEAKRGLAASADGLIRLPRVIPQRIAMEMALTGICILLNFWIATASSIDPSNPARRRRLLEGS